MEEQQKKAEEFQLAATALGNPSANADEQALLERREALVQLSHWQQDRSESMQKLFLKLCGYFIDKKGDKTVLKPIEWDKGYVSIMGAQKLVNFIEPLDRNVMLGNWGDKELTITLRDAIAHPLRNYIKINHESIGLSIQHASYVLWLIINTVEPTYRRGWNDGERRKDREIIKINELRNPDAQQKKKNIFGLEA